MDSDTEIGTTIASGQPILSRWAGRGNKDDSSRLRNIPSGPSHPDRSIPKHRKTPSFSSSPPQWEKKLSEASPPKQSSKLPSRWAHDSPQIPKAPASAGPHETAGSHDKWTSHSHHFPKAPAHEYGHQKKSDTHSHSSGHRRGHSSFDAHAHAHAQTQTHDQTQEQTHTRGHGQSGRRRRSSARQDWGGQRPEQPPHGSPQGTQHNHEQSSSAISDPTAAPKSREGKKGRRRRSSSHNSSLPTNSQKGREGYSPKPLTKDPTTMAAWEDIIATEGSWADAEAEQYPGTWN